MHATSDLKEVVRLISSKSLPCFKNYPNQSSYSIAHWSKYSNS